MAVKRMLERCPGCRRVEVSEKARGLCPRCYRELPEIKRKALETSRRWKRDNRERNRDREREYRLRTRKHCPDCGGLMEGRRSTTRQCADCVRATNIVRLSLIEGMWTQGWKALEIALVIGTTTNSLTTTLVAMRRNGWDVPARGPGGRILARETSPAGAHAP